METIGMLLLGVGCLAACVCGLWMLVIAFQESVAQGLLYWFVPFYAIYYVISRWEKCKTPFLCSLGAMVLVVLGAIMGGAGAAP